MLDNDINARQLDREEWQALALRYVEAQARYRQTVNASVEALAVMEGLQKRICAIEARMKGGL